MKKKPPPPRGNGITLCEPQTGHVKSPSPRSSPGLPAGWSASLRSARRRALRPNDRRIAGPRPEGSHLGRIKVDLGPMRAQDLAMKRRLGGVLAAAIVLVGIGLAAAAVLSPVPAEHAAMLKLQAVQPGVAWHVRATRLNLVPYRVYDSNGVLRESAPGDPCPVFRLWTCPPPPKWTVEASGDSPGLSYDALIDVAPVSNVVVGYQVGRQAA